MPLLEVTNLSKYFGGLRAVGAFSVTVDAGQIVGLIGPNGAGKTTVFNLISGFIEPDEGDVQFEGANLLGLRPHEVCMRGLTRTFQLVKPFAGLSVLENAMVGALRLQHNPRQARESAEEYLDLLGWRRSRTARPRR